jgi:hypothetical protein
MQLLPWMPPQCLNIRLYEYHYLRPLRFQVQEILCVRSEGSEASLEVRKLYELLPSTERERQSGMVRVIDESGEDYLFPESYFAAVVLPPETQERLRRTAE